MPASLEPLSLPRGDDNAAKIMRETRLARLNELPDDQLLALLKITQSAAEATENKSGPAVAEGLWNGIDHIAGMLQRRSQERSHIAMPEAMDSTELWTQLASIASLAAKDGGKKDDLQNARHLLELLEKREKQAQGRVSP